MSKFKTPEEALEAISKAADEVEALMKSWQGGMAKEDEGLEPESDEIQDTAAAEEAEEPSAEDADEPAPEADAGAEGGPEGSEDQEDAQRAEMEQHAAQLSDEELATLLDILSNEMEKRHAAGEGQEEGQEGAGAPEAQPSPAELERSMKSEFAKLSKSLTREIEKLKKSVNSLKSENESLKKKMALPRSKPVSTNARGVDKTPAQVEKLSKSETVEFLLGEMRKGNRNVNSELVALVNAVREDEELDYAHRQIRNAGIDLPTKTR